MVSTAESARAERVTRRQAFATGVVGGAALATAACGARSESQALSQPSKGTISIRAFIGGIDAAGMEQWESVIAVPYRQRRPNVNVELISQSAEISGIKTGGTLGVVEKLVAQIAAGDPPDIDDLPRSASWQVPMGFLDDQMDGFVKRDKYDTKQFNPKEFERRAVYRGKVYQIPFKYGGNTLVLVCNRDLFRAAGVPLPGADPGRAWDWNGFVDTLNRLTKRSGGTVTQFGLMNYGWHLGSWPLLWQADWVSADGKTITCDTADMQDCYSKFADLFHRHQIIPRPGEASQLFGTTQLFLNGKAAMALMASGSWLTYISRSELTDVAFAPMPKVKITTPDVNTHSLGIVRGSKLQADAWEVIKYFNEDSRLAAFAKRLPAILKNVEPWAKGELQRFPHADVKVVLRALETHVPQINLGESKYQDDMLRVLNPAMADLLAGKEAPVPLLKRLKPELQAIADRP